MQLIDQLRAEQDLIEQVAGAFRTFARQRARDVGDAGVAPARDTRSGRRR